MGSNLSTPPPAAEDAPAAEAAEAPAPAEEAAAPASAAAPEQEPETETELEPAAPAPLACTPDCSAFTWEACAALEGTDGFGCVRNFDTQKCEGKGDESMQIMAQYNMFWSTFCAAPATKAGLRDECKAKCN